jgi:hypothetical protein
MMIVVPSKPCSIATLQRLLEFIFDQKNWFLRLRFFKKKRRPKNVFEVLPVFWQIAGLDDGSWREIRPLQIW